MCIDDEEMVSFEEIYYEASSQEILKKFYSKTVVRLIF